MIAAQPNCISGVVKITRLNSVFKRVAPMNLLQNSTPGHFQEKFFTLLTFLYMKP